MQVCQLRNERAQGLSQEPAFYQASAAGARKHPGLRTTGLGAREEASCCMSLLRTAYNEIRLLSH